MFRRGRVRLGFVSFGGFRRVPKRGAERASMQFAVATRSFLAQVKLTPSLDLEGFHLIEQGRHYGIALPDDTGRRFMTMRRKDDLITTYERPSNGGEWRFAETDRFSLPGQFADVHQIAWIGGGLYLANSGYHRVEYVSFDDYNTQRLPFRQFGSVHLNSVFPHGRDCVLVVLHNKGLKYSEIGVVQRDTDRGLALRRMLTTWDTGCHNVYMDDHHLAYNASEVGDFVVVDVQSGKQLRRIHFPGHTKGLSVTEDYYVIGCSEFASRWARNTSRGQLAVIDRRSLELVQTIDLNHPSLPHPIGNVNEVRRLDAPDAAHAHLEEPSIDWEAFDLVQAYRGEQMQLRARRAAITTLKTAKTGVISVRERARRLWDPRVSEDNPRFE